MNAKVLKTKTSKAELTIFNFFKSPYDARLIFYTLRFEKIKFNVYFIQVKNALIKTSGFEDAAFL